jgi:hypothetical protein
MVLFRLRWFDVSSCAYVNLILTIESDPAYGRFNVKLLTFNSA